MNKQEWLKKSLERAESKLKRARSDYMIEYWSERVAQLKAAQQSVEPTVSTSTHVEENRSIPSSKDYGIS